MLLVLRVVKKTQSVQGLSLKTQQLYAMVFLTRLLFKIAYEQDYLYALIEMVATALTCHLIYLICVQYKATYQVCVWVRVFLPHLACVAPRRCIKSVFSARSHACDVCVCVHVWMHVCT